MIVNPREFSIRLTIGTLISAIAILVVFGFSNYDAVVAQNNFVEHQKKLLRNELGQLLKNYNELGDEAKDLKSQLIDEKTRIEIAQDSIGLLRADVALIPKLQNQLNVLRAQQYKFQPETYTYLIDSLTQVEGELEQVLSVQKNVIQTLEEEKETLKNNLELGKQVYANSFKAQALKRKKTGPVATTKASQAEYIDVSFVLAENPIAEDGPLDVYIQVLGPDNNVVADQGSVQFDDDLLIFSHKITVDYNKKTKNICTAIYNQETFNQGKYYISIFHKNRKLGSTEFVLK